MASAAVLWSFVLPTVTALEVRLNTNLKVKCTNQTFLLPLVQQNEWDRLQKTARSIQKLPLFTSLILRKSPFASETELLEFLKKTPSLSELEISWFSITDEFLQTVVKLCPLLETVRVSFCKEITDEGIASLMQLTKLRTLDLAGCSKITGSALTLPKAGHPLTYLNLNHLPELSTETMLTVFELHPQLKMLFLAGCKQLGGKIFESGKIPPLEKLGLAHWEISDQQLFEIAQKTPLLNFLNLNQSRGYSWKGLSRALQQWNQLQRLEFVSAKLDRDDPDAQLMARFAHIQLIWSLRT
ncbi:MAG: hypothetical protein JSR58_06480 [Verrucomicrobia bacterium]|nr:hypothetical protein [Verrucomicrobiota bacterium]